MAPAMPEMPVSSAVVIGGAGFIGSHLVDALADAGVRVTVVDDFSVGRREFLARSMERIAVVELHVGHAPADVARLAEVVRGHDVVVHLAANPEARWGLENSCLDLEQGTLATYNVLEAMRRTGVKTFVLSSSGTVYGDIAEPVAEDHGPLNPISLYGATKLASEGLASAFAHCFGQRAVVFRFGNVVGGRATHGAALDFVKKLEATPTRLEVLGDGRQAKPYLHVSDCVAGIIYGVTHAPGPFDCFNLAPEDVTSVREIATAVVEELGLDARIDYTGGDRGWPGDVPRSRLKPDKLARLGFRVRMRSTEAIRLAISEIVRERKGR